MAACMAMLSKIPCTNRDCGVKMTLILPDPYFTPPESDFSTVLCCFCQMSWTKSKFKEWESEILNFKERFRKIEENNAALATKLERPVDTVPFNGNPKGSVIVRAPKRHPVVPNEGVALPNKTEADHPVADAALRSVAADEFEKSHVEEKNLPSALNAHIQKLETINSLAVILPAVGTVLNKDASSRGDIVVSASAKSEEKTVDDVVLPLDVTKQLSPKACQLAGRPPKLCDTCGASFKTQRGLKAHIERHSAPRNRFSCALCSVSYSEKHRLKEHMKEHSGGRPYCCEKCGASYLKRYLLKLHLMAHDGERPHECEHCGMTFIHVNALKKHRMRHTNEKPFRCSVCGAGFRQGYDLKRHILVHTGEKPFSCEMCEAVFTQAINLRRHMASHERGRARGNRGPSAFYAAEGRRALMGILDSSVPRS